MTRLGLGIATAIAILLLGIVQANAQPAPVINACVNKYTGQVAIPAMRLNGGTCSWDEVPLMLNTISGYEIVAKSITQSITSVARDFAFQVFCPAGKKVLGGGAIGNWFNTANANYPAMISGLPVNQTVGPNNWQVNVDKADGSAFLVGESISVLVTVVCAYAQ